MSECEHAFQYCGVVYSHSDYSMPGTGARQRYLEDKFFCSKCLETRYENRRPYGNSYQDVPNGTLPK